MFMTRKKKRAIMTAIGLVAGIALVIGILIAMRYKHYQTTVDELVFSDIELASLTDGIYIGEYDADIIYAKVEVIIQEGRISDLTILEHRNERGSDAEAIITDIIREQSLDVDTVSSATNSCKVIRKAIEHALTGHQAK